MVVYEGAIEDISSKQLDFVTTVLDKHGFGDAKVTVKPVGAAGDNYAANVKRFVAEKAGKTLKIVGKVAPVIGQMRQAGNTAGMFYNEYAMYSAVLPKFTELEIAAGIPEEDRLRYAKFYGAYMEEPYEIILLEDLQESGFVILNRFKSLNNETVRLILKNFARLHALSYVLKIKEPELFASFKSRLIDLYKAMANDENNKYFLDVLDKDACTLLEFERHRNAVKGKIANMCLIAVDLSKEDYDSRHSVIQQGDSWTNNIMFIMESNAFLKYHLRTHTGEKPYQCQLCPKRFAMPIFLQIHTRTHTGERPYPCEVCKKGFISKPALLRHHMVHTGEKPYQCPECGKTFSQSNSMKLHVHTVHLKLPSPYKSTAKKKKEALALQQLMAQSQAEETIAEENQDEQTYSEEDDERNDDEERNDEEEGNDDDEMEEVPYEVAYRQMYG